MVRPFVLNELQPFLHIEQNRVEMQPRSMKLRRFLQLGSHGLRAGGVSPLSLDEALDDILF
jgi:hypothetical protein